MPTLRRPLFVILSTLLASVVDLPFAWAKVPVDDVDVSMSRPFALIELFTSQGCSSCPSADRLLGDVDAESRKRGLRVFVLSLHVDYWNQLGWVDRFSAPAYSSRQKRYAHTFRLGRIYTPQVLVNGTVEFVGSNAKRVDHEIKSALSRQPEVDLSLRAVVSADGQSAHVNYEIQGRHDVSDFCMAVVENGLVTNIDAGENNGRVLRHDGVVRAFRSIPLNAPVGSVEVDLSNTESEAVSLVGFIQENQGMRILAAERVDLFAKK